MLEIDKMQQGSKDPISFIFAVPCVEMPSFSYISKMSSCDIAAARTDIALIR